MISCSNQLHMVQHHCFFPRTWYIERRSNNNLLLHSKVHDFIIVDNKIFYLSFHVSNYTHLGSTIHTYTHYVYMCKSSMYVTYIFTHNLIHRPTYETKCDTKNVMHRSHTLQTFSGSITFITIYYYYFVAIYY